MSSEKFAAGLLLPPSTCKKRAIVLSDGQLAWNWWLGSALQKSSVLVLLRRDVRFTLAIRVDKLFQFWSFQGNLGKLFSLALQAVE